VGIIFETTGELITSLRNTLTYFASTGTSNAIERVVLSGGGSALGGFGAAVSEYTRLPVSAGDPFGNIVIGRQADKSMKERGMDSSMTVAIGLALGTAA